ncbi:sensor histidine kinase [Streptomyces solicathayae]|uniref:Histidine kinase n=1 Tax=Streptomyces solicathayae TaxID=3081768 RepID=A0ABZ0LPZ7_9ACTN|nr:ATP-binding protein [Streptomyces sp. HUAS YS2]WOX21427.1 histidine kinase [Streptomyces sp. HUAS YS2]
MITKGSDQGAVGARPARDAAVREREWSAAAFCVLLCVLSVLGWGSLCTLHPPRDGWYLDMGSDLSTALVGPPCAVLGFLVLVRAADRTAGWLLLVTGIGLTLPLITGQLVVLAEPGPRVRLAAQLFAQLCSLAHGYAMVVLPLTFPAPRRAGPVVRLYVATLAALCVGIALVATAVEEAPGAGAHPLHGTSWERAALAVLEPCAAANLWLLLGCTLVNVSVVARRWGRAGRWARGEAVVFGAAYLPWTYGDIAEELPGLPPWTVIAAFVTGAVGWYAAVAYVIGKGGMWQIGRTSRRLLVTAVVVTAVVLAYTAAAATVSTALPDADGAGASAVAVVAVLIGSGLRPLASWASRRVDHVFHGKSSVPYEAVRVLARRLREAPEPDDVPVVLCRCATEDLRFPMALVEVATRSGPCVLAAIGGPWHGEGAHEFLLRHHDEVIGTLRVAPRSGEPHLSGRDAELLQLLSDQAAPAMAALRLIQDVRAARRQLVLAREEERRRLRRELHDGLGPLLAAARMHLDTALAVIPPAAPAPSTPTEPARHAATPSVPSARPIPAPAETAAGVEAALRPAVEAVVQATAETRRLTDGLGPTVLTEQGLDSALRELARTLAAPGMVVTVVTDTDTDTDQQPEPDQHPDRHPDADPAPDQGTGSAPEPPLPAAVESAVYRIASEALTNTVRHAGATRCEIRLTRQAHAAALTVVDDGTGLPARVRPGAVGLASMAERARELGGVCEVTSGPAGTRVHAVLPTAAVPPPPVPAAGRDRDETGASCARDNGRRKL